MPLFVIIGHDVADSTKKRQSVRPQHLARLQQLKDKGRLVIAGPTPIKHEENQMSGSVMIAEFETLEEVQTWCQDEPYLQQGVYSHVDIKPFIQVF